MKCVKNLEVKPLKSAAGWYMGTVTEEGMPNCRITTMYYNTPEEAEKSLFADYRYCSENSFCSGGRVCVDWPVK